MFERHSSSATHRLKKKFCKKRKKKRIDFDGLFINESIFIVLLINKKNGLTDLVGMKFNTKHLRLFVYHYSDESANKTK